jgi:hypothetical protein
VLPLIVARDSLGVQLLWRDLTNGYRENLNIQ